MRNEFLEIISRLSKTNPAESPGFVTFMALAKHSKAIYKSPVEIASLIKVQVNESFTRDSFLFNQVVNSYVEILNKIWNELISNFGDDVSLAVLKNKASEMSITYTF